MPPIPARMLATVYHWESGFQVEEMTTPRPGLSEVLIQVDSCGICASDLKFIHNLVDQRVGEGRILGHEFSGTVVETGPAVSGVAVGDPVAVDPVMSCGSCYECRRANPHYCLRKQTIGFSRPGAFAQ